MAPMTDQETWDFLATGTRTAHVGSVRADGRPHVKPVWFVLDGRPGPRGRAAGHLRLTRRGLAR